MLTRRRFGTVALTATAALAGCAAPRKWGGNGSTRVDPRRTDDGVAWVNRLTWGADSASLADWAGRSPAAFLADQLRAEAAPALPAEVQARVDALGVNQRSSAEWAAALALRRRDAEALTDLDARRAARQAYQRDLNGLSRDASAQFLWQALYSTQQLREQLAWFWFNHFNVHQYKRDLRALVGDYQAQLRGRALGRFQDLLIASATHPAMLRYLDNERNAVDRLNENFARELLELHTLGVDAGYTQKDVQELARVMTGLGVNVGEKTPNLTPSLRGLYVRRGATEFNPERHDMHAKTLLGVEVAGRGWDEILGELVRLARHPATARHVSRRLAIHFCADDPDPALVDRMTETFSASDGRIDDTLQTMFESPTFAASLGGKFKDPVHYVVSAVRLACDGRTVLDTAPMQTWISRLGEGLYDRQTPDGYPLDAAAWAASGQMRARFDVARAIATGRAGLFRTDAAPPADATVQALSQVGFRPDLFPTPGPATRESLGRANSVQERNVLLLSSPEFMFR